MDTRLRRKIESEKRKSQMFKREQIRKFDTEIPEYVKSKKGFLMNKVRKLYILSKKELFDNHDFIPAVSLSKTGRKPIPLQSTTSLSSQQMLDASTEMLENMIYDLQRLKSISSNPNIDIYLQKSYELGNHWSVIKELRSGREMKHVKPSSKARNLNLLRDTVNQRLFNEQLTQITREDFFSHPLTESPKKKTTQPQIQIQSSSSGLPSFSQEQKLLAIDDGLISVNPVAGASTPARVTPTLFVEKQENINIIPELSGLELPSRPIFVRALPGSPTSSIGSETKITFGSPISKRTSNEETVHKFLEQGLTPFIERKGQTLEELELEVRNTGLESKWSDTEEEEEEVQEVQEAKHNDLEQQEEQKQREENIADETIVPQQRIITQEGKDFFSRVGSVMSSDQFNELKSLGVNETQIRNLISAGLQRTDIPDLFEALSGGVNADELVRRLRRSTPHSAGAGAGAGESADVGGWAGAGEIADMVNQGIDTVADRLERQAHGIIAESDLPDELVVQARGRLREGSNRLREALRFVDRNNDGQLSAQELNEAKLDPNVMARLGVGQLGQSGVAGITNINSLLAQKLGSVKIKKQRIQPISAKRRASQVKMIQQSIASYKYDRDIFNTEFS